jgi:uncharacterized protein YeaO (DUF488 family)
MLRWTSDPRETCDMTIKLNRVYEPAERGDGLRVLVDRLWPRGVKKDAVDLWLKEVAPSNELRNWLHNVEPKWALFRTKFRKELTRNAEAVAALRTAVKGKTATLLYGARDTEHNQAIVIADFLKKPRAKKAAKKA